MKKLLIVFSLLYLFSTILVPTIFVIKLIRIFSSLFLISKEDKNHDSKIFKKVNNLIDFI